MLSRLNGAVWMEDEGVKDSTTKSNDFNSSCGMMERKEEMDSISGFKSMLEVEDDWFVTNNSIHNQQDITFSPNLGDPDNLLLHSLDSSASCSPSSSVFNNLNPSQVPYFMHQKPTLSSLLNVVSSHPLEIGFSLGEIGFLENQATISANASTLMNRRGEVLENFTDFSSTNQMNTPNLCSELQLPENGPGFTGFRGFDDNSVDTLFFNRSKLLRPLGTFPSMGAQPTLFQKRAALRMNFSDNNNNNDKLWALGGIEKDKGKTEMAEIGEENERKKRKLSSGDDIVGDVSIDGSGFNYDSDELTETIKVEDFGKNEGNSSNANSSITEGGVCGDGNQHKGKKKGLPAKNLMAERRRRKKLNDRLYMLRSIVPKISKMDRASILGDAIEYLKELLQKINDLHNELESTPTGSMVPTTSFHPLTPTTPSALSNRMKEKLCPSPLPSPTSQPANVEVRFREGRSVNIHMFCGRRPGLLLSTVRALENLGLDIQQAVISCFNGFTMDIFHAEQCGPDLHPEQIKATLIDSAGLLGL